MKNKIVFFGTSEFAADILQALSKDPDFSIELVVTQPDRPFGRSQTVTPPPAKRAAETLGLPVEQPESVKGEDVAKKLEAVGATVFVVAAYGKILPKRILDIPPMGCVNVHGSLLPKYRGASPISEAILAGEKVTGNTIMLMDEKMDEGPILATGEVAIKDEDDTETLRARLAKAGAELLVPTLKLYIDRHIEPKPQDHAQASYSHILTKDDGKIDWSKSAEQIERQSRAMKPWPGVYTTWKRGDKPLRLMFRKISVLSPDSKCDTSGKPGAVCKLNDGTLGVNCGKGSILIERLQIEGKGEMEGKSFLNGYADFAGAVME